MCFPTSFKSSLLPRLLPSSVSNVLIGGAAEFSRNVPASVPAHLDVFMPVLRKVITIGRTPRRPVKDDPVRFVGCVSQERTGSKDGAPRGLPRTDDEANRVNM